MNSISSAPQTPVSGRVIRICRILTTGGLVVLLTACAAGKPSASGVEARAQARWDALLAEDYDTAYSFYSPGYRSSHSRVDFEIDMRTRKVRWVSAKVTGSSCKAEACTVETSVNYRVVKPVPGISEWKNSEKGKEQWVKTDREWWYLPNN